jgi:hypothetical protein
VFASKIKKTLAILSCVPLCACQYLLGLSSAVPETVLNLPCEGGACGAALVGSNEIVTTIHCADRGSWGCRMEFAHEARDLAWLSCPDMHRNRPAKIRMPELHEEVTVYHPFSCGERNFCGREGSPAVIKEMIIGRARISGRWIRGDSGSPVFGSDGALIGILTQSVLAGDGRDRGGIIGIVAPESMEPSFFLKDGKMRKPGFPEFDDDSDPYEVIRRFLEQEDPFTDI